MVRVAKDQQVDEVVRQRAAWALEKFGGMR
jgi:hypothetical protein